MMEKDDQEMTRRAFVGTAALGSMAVSGLPGRLQTGAWTLQEKANVQVVNDFCAAWSSRDMAKPLSFLASDSTYRMTETTPPVKGHAGVIDKLKTYVDASNSVEFKVLETFAKGPVVMNHRIDSFLSKARPLIWEGVGVFLVQDGKIKEWSDYTISVKR